MISRLLLCALAILGFTACSSPEPQNLFNTGRDERVFNPATGRYEWPNR